MCFFVSSMKYLVCSTHYEEMESLMHQYCRELALVCSGLTPNAWSHETALYLQQRQWREERKAQGRASLRGPGRARSGRCHYLCWIWGLRGRKKLKEKKSIKLKVVSLSGLNQKPTKYLTTKTNQMNNNVLYILINVLKTMNYTVYEAYSL